MTTRTPVRSLSEAASTRKDRAPLMTLVFVVGMLLAAAAAGYAYYEAQRTERVFVLARQVNLGAQIVAEDLTAVEVARYRPQQLAGVVDAGAIVGHYAARDLAPDDLVQPGMLLDAPPAEPVYPNGRKLAIDMVPVPFAIAAVGPLTDRDLLNVLFISPDAELCRSVGGRVTPGAAERSYACRFLNGVRVLYIDGQTAYLEMTPFQSQAIWALTGAGVQLVGERYGVTSQPLPNMERLDAATIQLDDLERAPAPAAAAKTAPQTPAAPQAASPIPGAAARIPGAPAEPTAAPLQTP